jgi:hypothetical protein
VSDCGAFGVAPSGVGSGGQLDGGGPVGAVCGGGGPVGAVCGVSVGGAAGASTVAAEALRRWAAGGTSAGGCAASGTSGWRSGAGGWGLVVRLARGTGVTERGRAGSAGGGAGSLGDVTL